MTNWFNWYWWVPDEKAEVNEEDSIDSIDDEIFQKDEEVAKEESSAEEVTKEENAPTEEVINQEVEVKPKPKRKKRTVTKKVSTKSQDAIEIILRPSILEELEKEAIISDSTLNQVIQVILEAHIDSKGADNTQTEVWKCTYCEPEREFRDYFDFSEHFFNLHMQPGLQKISEFSKEQ